MGHACAISAMVVPTWFQLLNAPPGAQFAPPGPEFSDWYWQNMIAANAAHIFLCYIICDFIVGFIHGLHQSGNALHHVIFASFTTLVMYNCFFAFGACTLLLMELSTIVLNYFTFWRNRLGYENTSVKLAMTLFAFLFFVCRIVCIGGLLYYYGRLLW